MKHCYVFDYSSASIYHTLIPDIILDEDIETYLIEHFSFNPGTIYFMTSYNPLTIEEL